ncbi:hypothetical protein EKO27_g11746 [Xylaria grammica]|uniref:Integrase catalytic domain-containing protein n=1 Tax=Xylaria grammica TaxID=363999 RepID=A0A439CMH0_9PEZI|nr:hypothetical protein EKO27_g11746 [Xylaria grammica]
MDASVFHDAEGPAGPQDQPAAPQPSNFDTYESVAEEIGISPNTVRTYIDMTQWDEDIDPNNATRQQLNTWAAYQVIYYRRATERGNIAYMGYAGDFKGWTIDHFRQVHRTISKRLLGVLEEKGIIVRLEEQERSTILDNLVRILQGNYIIRDSQPSLQATNNPVGTVRNTSASPTPSQQLRLASQDIPTPQSPVRPENPQSEAANNVQFQIPGVRYAQSPVRPTIESQSEPTYGRTIRPGHEPNFQPVYEYPVAHYPPQTPRQQTYVRTTPEPASINPVLDLPPTRNVRNGMISPEKYALFQKTWKHERNYSGEPYDLLYDKARLFIDACRRLGITEDQYHAVFPTILQGRAEDYYTYHIGPDKTWSEIYRTMDTHFNTNTNHSHYWADWTTITFARMKEENPDSAPHEVLDLMINKLAKAQRALGASYQGEIQLSTTVARACRGVPELNTALILQKPSCEGFFADLRACLRVAADTSSRGFIQENNDAYFTDRRYTQSNRTKSFKPRFQPRFGNRSNVRQGQPQAQEQSSRPRTNKTCFVCRKEGCWSTNHTPQERARVKNQYFNSYEMINGSQPTPDEFSLFLTECEGYPESDEGEEDTDEEIGRQSTQFLMDNAFLHRTTGEDIWNHDASVPCDQFILNDQYRTEYQGELWDTGASNYSTVGKAQLEAYLRIYPRTKVSWTPGTANIRFGGSDTITAIGTVRINNPLGTTTYHILDSHTPFLFSLKDADQLQAYYDNTKDIIVRKDGKTIPVVRKWGHPFFNTSPYEAGIYFTETELRRLHRRFGHPRTERLYNMLSRAGHDVDHSTLEEIQKFCHHCQSHDRAPQRFKFSIKDDCNFNYEVIIDAVRLADGQVLHVIDAATSFQAATFLKSMSARDAWEALCKCWINVYQGPPDYVVHDPGTNFSSEEFRNQAKIVGTQCRAMPVEAHWAIGKIERAHGPLRRTYDILKAEIGHRTEKESILQMAVKALNDTAGPNGLVPTLLVFGAYPRVNQDSPPSPDIVRRAEAVKKAMKMLRDERAKVEINRAINQRNGPISYDVLSLPLRSEVLVWREKKGWDGPYEIQSIEGSDIIIDSTNGPIRFRCTQVKPYYRTTEDLPLNTPEDLPLTNPEDLPLNDPEERPPTVQPSQPLAVRRKRGRPRKTVSFYTPSARQTGHMFLSQKEEQSYALAIKLREDGIINTPGAPFEESDATEINDLVARGVFQFVRYNPAQHGDIRIFKSRLVREVKGKTTKPYEKSRLVVQGYNDTEKETVLTQSPTIQRMSQRLILALGPSLVRDFNASGELRDITQAYVQSQDKLARKIIARLPSELKPKYPEGTVLRIVRPLYGLAESGLYWFKTYHQHHRQKLGMDVSTYDPCLLISTGQSHDFGITGLQTDDTFSFVTPSFSEKEEQELQKAKFRAKPKEVLRVDHPIEFNGGRINLSAEGNITLTQKGQASQLAEIDPRTKDFAQQYISQRARGAYISSICQPEAAYDLSAAAQVTDPTPTDVRALNQRIKWQMDNQNRGLTFIPLDLRRTKLFIFTDGSFANNADMSSQLGFLIVLATEHRTEQNLSFEIQGNIVHWNSSKCKRVTRSVLASELYGMVNGFDSAIALRTTIQKIVATLGIPPIPAVLCSDSKSLYDCLVKLGTTQEKRLMIDIMSLRESYEKREISDVRWINGKDNPADAFTKRAPNQALETLVSTNRLTVRVEAFVERA